VSQDIADGWEVCARHNVCHRVSTDCYLCELSDAAHQTREEVRSAPAPWNAAVVVDTTADDVSKQPHYAACDPEPIKVTEGWKLGFNLGNVIKYIARHNLKGTPLKDLKKARWYLDRHIATLEGRK
jgi:hypothetical protein